MEADGKFAVFFISDSDKPGFAALDPFIRLLDIALPG